MLNLYKRSERAGGNERARAAVKRDLDRASDLLGLVEAAPKSKSKPAQELKLETNSERTARLQKEREQRAANRPPSLVKELNKKIIEKGFSESEKVTILKNLETAADAMNDPEKEANIMQLLVTNPDQVGEGWMDEYLKRYEIARHPDASPERDLAREQLQEVNRMLGVRGSKDLQDANFKPAAKSRSPAESPLARPLEAPAKKNKRGKRG